MNDLTFENGWYEITRDFATKEEVQKEAARYRRRDIHSHTRIKKTACGWTVVQKTKYRDPV